MFERCPNCEVGNLAPRVATESIAYGGKQLSVEGIEYSVCDACGEDIVTADQARPNDVRFADAKRSAESLLLSGDIREFREKYKLTQADASRIFGGGVNAFSKYERGEILQSTQMDLLIRLCRELPVARDWLFGWAGISAPWDNLPCDVIPITRGLGRAAPTAVTPIETPTEDQSEDWQPIASSL